jgi:hypothetical protein
MQSTTEHTRLPAAIAVRRVGSFVMGGFAHVLLVATVVLVVKHTEEIS